MERAADALSHGYTAAFIAEAALLGVAALIVGLMVTTRSGQHTAATSDTAEAA